MESEFNKKIVKMSDPESKRLYRTLAVKMLEIAIESGATYGEIRKSCAELLDILEKGTKPEFTSDCFGNREISDFRKT